MKKILIISIILLTNIYGSCNKTSVTATLDGSKSFDPDGYIVSYRWRQISGPTNVTIDKPSSVITTVRGTPKIGNYFFELMGTDNDGITRYDTVMKSISGK